MMALCGLAAGSSNLYVVLMYQALGIQFGGVCGLWYELSPVVVYAYLNDLSKKCVYIYAHIYLL